MAIRCVVLPQQFGAEAWVITTVITQRREKWSVYAYVVFYPGISWKRWFNHCKDRTWHSVFNREHSGALVCCFFLCCLHSMCGTQYCKINWVFSTSNLFSVLRPHTFADPSYRATQKVWTKYHGRKLSRFSYLCVYKVPNKQWEVLVILCQQLNWGAIVLSWSTK